QRSASASSRLNIESTPGQQEVIDGRRCEAATASSRPTGQTFGGDAAVGTSTAIVTTASSPAAGQKADVRSPAGRRQRGAAL
ncbi:hypothetical protein, partial [Enterobacter hormaechei]|uniref:hypothetical protein n=1 Tax=Enterobacter hormaechei TaxID=158836 RepID=UPI003BCD92B1